MAAPRWRRISQATAAATLWQDIIEKKLCTAKGDPYGSLYMCAAFWPDILVIISLERYLLYMLLFHIEVGPVVGCLAWVGGAWQMQRALLPPQHTS